MTRQPWEAVRHGSAYGGADVIGANVKAARLERGMSLRALATASGLSAGYLSKVERGLANLDRRRSLLDVADALHVPPNRLTGQPYDAATRAEELVRVTVADMRDLLYGSAIGAPVEDAPGRDLPALRVATDRAASLYADCAVEPLAQLLPGLLSDLYGHTAAGGEDAAEAVALLPVALNAAWNLAHWAGEPEVAYRAAEQATVAAELDGDPALRGFAAFGIAHTLGHVNGKRARVRGGQVATAAADQLEEHAAAGPSAEMFGMLHLTAAWADLLAGDGSRVDEHVDAAAAAAERTGDGTYGRLWFGPSNVAAWRVALAVELGDGGRVPELAAAVDLDSLPAAERKAGHLINLGRGLAQEPATARDALPAFRRARRLTPTRTRWNPHVRLTVEQLLYEVGGTDVRAFASWLGVIPH